MKEQQLEDWVRAELKTVLPNIIWRNDLGEYELFGRYKILKERNGYRVFCSATDVGLFSGTKAAVSWCIADKYCDYNLARHILHTDNRLEAINNDIYVRVGAATRSKKAEFKENIDIKLEPKIIRKRELEKQLTKYVDLAKYLQQRGFDNEIARSGRTTKNTTNR
jgi:hypothetical protein